MLCLRLGSKENKNFNFLQKGWQVDHNLNINELKFLIFQRVKIGFKEGFFDTRMAYFNF